MSLKKTLIITASLSLLFSISIKTSYAFFDSMFSRNGNLVNIGSWTPQDVPLTLANLNNYLSSYNTVITTKADNRTVNMRNYLNTVLFEQGGTINRVFNGYTLNEMIKTIDDIKTNTQSFLILDSNNQGTFPSISSVNYITLNPGKSFLPGDSVNINTVLLTANLSSLQYWSPFTLSITLESLDGKNLSDFAVETLIDYNAFTTNKPFAYSYLLKDENSWNTNRATGEANKQENVPVKVMINKNYNTQIYKATGSSYTLKNYRQKTILPVNHGNWARLPYGPNYLLDRPTNSSIGMQQQFTELSASMREGLILAGKANGLRSELKIDFPERSAVNGTSVPIIPIILSISRGQELNSAGNPIANQNSTAITPVIKIKINQGQVWN